MYLGIEHVTLSARDPAALARWYCDVLGYRLAYENRGVLFLSRGAGCMIELLRGPGGLNDVMADNNKGAAIFGVLVEDLAAAIADLEQKGVELVDEPMADETAAVQFFKDGEGNLLHLIARGRR